MEVALTWLIWLGVAWLGAMFVSTLVAVYLKITDDRGGE